MCAGKRTAFLFSCNRYEQYQDFTRKLRAEELAARKEAIRTLPEYSQYAERMDRMSDYDLHNVFPRKPMEDYLKSQSLDYRSISEVRASSPVRSFLRCANTMTRSSGEYSLSEPLIMK